VHDVPLLVEAGMAAGFDVVVVVDAPPETRLDRLVRQRGMSRPDAEARMAAQATREQRLAVADHVLTNDGSLESLAGQVDALWRILTNGPHPADTVT
jgi:dephospho-CoA kinase